MAYIAFIVSKWQIVYTYPAKQTKWRTAYPRPYAPGQESEGSGVENELCLERAADYSNKDLEDVARLIHLYLGIL